jgi:CRP/FNR family cyclic AMP-dependent transcriptional regulator
MSLGPATMAAQRPVEDPLAHLPCSTILAFNEGQSIYSPGDAATGIYLIMEGKVKAGRMADNGREIVVDVYQVNDIFGQSAFIEQTRSGFAVALESTRLMMWSLAQIGEIAARSPKLHVALIQLLAGRLQQFEQRIESFAVDNVGRRLARTLIQFSGRQANATSGSAVQIPPVTHELLAQYIGTSREVVTQYMNQFRRQGFLSYSRKGILVRLDRMEEWLSGKTAAPITPGTHAAGASEKAMAMGFQLPDQNS